MSGITRTRQTELTIKRGLHYFEVTIPDQVHGATKRCCGTLKDVNNILALFPDASFKAISLPPPPVTVDVSFAEVEAEKALPESDATPLEL